MANLRVMGRNTQGVKLIRIQDGDAIGSVAKIERLEGEEEATNGIQTALPLASYRSTAQTLTVKRSG